MIVIGANSFSGKAFCKYAKQFEEVMPLTRDKLDLSKDFELPAGDVINFAALNMVGESWEYAEDYYRVNVEGIARLARKFRGRKFVQVSTPEVYGNTAQMLRENEPFNPSTPYAISRAAADWHLAKTVPVCFTRTVNVYGPGQPGYRIIPKTILSILEGKKLPLHGGGHSVRSFIHINDVAAGIYKVYKEGKVGETYHMAHPQSMSIRDVVSMICDKMGVALHDVIEDVGERRGKDPAYILNDDKIRLKLDWSHTIDLEDGLDEMIDYYRNNKEGTEYAHRQLEPR